MSTSDISRLRALEEADRPLLSSLLESVEVFYPYEVAEAVRQFDDYLRGPSRQTTFHRGLFSETGDLQAYLSLCSDPSSDHYWKLNWLVVSPRLQGQGTGSELLMLAHSDVRQRGGKAILVETGSNEGYARTRHFYEIHGYKQVGRIPLFFSLEDDKVIYVKLF
jgi:GNAT superfamily N-acetyltransferase